MKTLTIAVLLSLLILSPVVQGQWVQTNGPSGGYVCPIAVCGQSVLAGTSNNGVFRSSDHGSSWTSAGLRGLEINCLVASGTNIYASSGRNGVYWSADNGSSWSRVDWWNSWVNCIAVCGPYLLVGTDGQYAYRSSDNGSNWIQTTAGLQSGDVHCLVASDTVLFAGTGQGGVYRSRDFGLNWELLAFEGVQSNVAHLAVNQTSVFAAVTESGASTIYRSTDDGTTWTNMSRNLLIHALVTCLAASDDFVFVGSDATVYRSHADSSTWVQADTGLHRGVYGLATDGVSIFAGTNGAGVYVSRNNGSTWLGTEMTNSRVRCLTRNNTCLLAGERDGGLFRSTDEGENWVNVGFAGRDIASLGAFGPNLFAGIGEFVSPDAYRSTDNGTSWEEMPTFRGQRVCSFVADGSRVFAAADAGIYCSTDSGSSWEQIFDSPQSAAAIGLFVRDQWVFAHFASWFEDSFIYRSTDGGKSWVALDPRPFPVVTIGPWWLGLGGTVGVFRSSDNGETWSHSSTGIKQNVRTIAADSNTLFAATDDGVFLSCDTGSTWSQVSEGMYPNTAVTSLVVDKGALYAATDGHGVWRRPLSELTVSVHEQASREVASAFALSQNYPNPFNPITTIEYAIPVGTYRHTSLRVFDILGREVATLVDGLEEPGNKSVQWDGSGVASGVYLYRLQAGEFLQTKKLLLLK